MSNPLNLYPGQSALIIDGEDMKDSDVLTSTTLNVGNALFLSFQAVWTGSATGTFAVSASIDNITFSAIDLTVVDPSGSDGHMIAMTETFGLPYWQIQYTNVSGTGVLSVQACVAGKGV